MKILENMSKKPKLNIEKDGYWLILWILMKKKEIKEKQLNVERPVLA